MFLMAFFSVVFPAYTLCVFFYAMFFVFPLSSMARLLPRRLPRHVHR